ncbi:MAG: cytochrome P450 [Pseudomonadales bacterium]|nr:cytochrome P450 [Pseudomonadales bacterium]
MEFTTILNPESSLNVNEILEEIQTTSPRYFLEQGNFKGWIITRFDDVSALLKDSRLTTGNVGAFIQSLPESQQRQLQDLKTLSQYSLGGGGKEQHKRLKDLYREYFTHKYIESMRPEIAQICQDMLANIETDDFDIAKELTNPLPAYVIATLLGAPQKDWHLFIDFSRKMIGMFVNYTLESYLEAQQGFMALADYSRNLIEIKRQNPDNKLISFLLKAEARGEISVDEIITNTAVFLMAGHETTSQLLNKGIHALHNNPGQWKKLYEDQSLIENTVRELLRHSGGALWSRRIITEDFTFNDVEFKQGQMVFLSLYASNRDANHFENPHELDIERENTQRHMAFALGAHYCLGAQLALVEAEEVFKQLLHFMPQFEIDEKNIDYFLSPLLRATYLSLPIQRVMNKNTDMINSAVLEE